VVKDLPRSLGLPDDAFEQRRPNKGQITKREVRAVSLYSLGLRQDSVVWDVGAGKVDSQRSRGIENACLGIPR